MCLHKFVKLVTSSVHARKFYTEQMFVLVRMQFHNHVDTQTVKRFERAMPCIYDIKFGMLQVRKNEISLRKSSGVSAHLRTLGEHWSPGSLRDLITMTVNLNRKLRYLSSLKKIKIS